MNWRTSAVLVGFAAALFACDDGKKGDESSKAPDPPSEGGVLGEAIFTYKCTANSDAQCDFDQQLGTGTGNSQFSLPPVATGAKFGLDYKLYDTTAPPADVVSFHPTFATFDPTGITTVKAGNTTVGLKRGNDVVDMVDVKIMDPTSLKVFTADPQGEYTDVSIHGGKVTATATFTFRFRVAPANGDTILAGSFPCNWTTSDVNIAKITTPPDDNIVTIVTGGAPGTATIHVDLGPQKMDIPITVGG